MATFKICVFEHQKRMDGKYPVSIRVTSNRQTCYLSTGIYVTRPQISKDFKTIRDASVTRSIDKQIQKYENIIIQHLGVSVKDFSAKELCEYLTKQAAASAPIDFVQFSRAYTGKMLDKGRTAYAKLIETSLNALVDFFGREKIYIKEITSKTLAGFADYLHSERKMMRRDRNGRQVEIIRGPVSDRTVSDYMTNLRTLFNAAMAHYNDEELGVRVITHYPFRKFKIKHIQESRNRNLSANVIRQIRDFECPSGDPKRKRIELSRDVFMLSFYLGGMNLADLYEVTDYRNERISYERRKTRERREDSAFISVKVQPEAMPLLEKYRDLTGKRVFRFYHLYGNHKDFVRGVNTGLKEIARRLEEISELCDAHPLKLDNLTSYYARHSVATIARNDCGVSKDDVNLLLNHVDQNMKITDIYLAKDWSIMDKAIRKVIDCVNRA